MHREKLKFQYGNQKPHVNEKLREAIIKQSALKYKGNRKKQ